ncbi:MAG TPA: ferredoxin [Acidimicrobiia bacterium]|nr:ferredoxin [Acidimicrobiia bacterium]
MQLRIDRERCCGHGRCYDLHPSLFTYDEEGFGIVVADYVPSELADEARRSTADCPERAVTVDETDR